MSSMREQMTKAFEPEVAVNAIGIGKSKLEGVVLNDLYHFLSEHYTVLADTENDVIYLKRKEKT